MQGRPDEPFDAALRRSFGEPPHGNDYNLVWPNPSGTATWLGWITPHVTLAEAAAVADGETLHVDALGRGGGVLPLMLEIVEAGLTLTGVVQAASWAQTRLRNALSRTQRRLAKEWVDSGLASEPPLALRQYVYSESTWLRSDFDETFGLDRIAGPALLRRLHYDKTSTSPERWEEKPGP
ncbi:hypothetical protein SAMN05216418_1456 [Microbacterium enclense]|uniref:Uncharacterized protein n=1 Tax=Microbacterium enclense TaxID=993073 RepID=A0A1G6IBD0_9MICO|nr:hypothetical protein SAMN05216418_1456 [Microbacterium enclense]